MWYTNKKGTRYQMYCFKCVLRTCVTFDRIIVYDKHTAVAKCVLISVPSDDMFNIISFI